MGERVWISKMEDSEPLNLTDEDKLLQKHRNEKRELQAEIQKLKHSVPKGDKKKKKEVTEKIQSMEKDLEERHRRELAELDSPLVNDLATHVSNMSTDDAKGAIGGSMVEDTTPENNETETRKLSKAQKRRNKKAAAEKERQDQIDEQELSNLTGPRHLETQAIKAALAQKNLVISDIPSDGNCLYAALVHQLAQQNTQRTVQELRQLTAEHMRSHQDDFLPFLCHTDSGEPYTAEEYEAYCTELANSPVWGGQLEIQALSQILQAPITVIQAEGAPIVLGDGLSNEMLTLTYHRHIYRLGAHYNSVKPKPPDEEE